MSQPNYYPNNNVNLVVEASYQGRPFAILSAAVNVWDPSDTLIVEDAAMSVSGHRASYQVATSDTATPGTYKAQFAVTFTQSLGVLSEQSTFVVRPGYP